MEVLDDAENEKMTLITCTIGSKQKSNSERKINSQQKIYNKWRKMEQISKE